MYENVLFLTMTLTDVWAQLDMKKNMLQSTLLNVNNATVFIFLINF